MPTISINSWNGGISNHYHTGQENQCADMENIDISTHPDAIMLANKNTVLAESTGEIACGFFLGEFIKKENVGFVFATLGGEVFYNNIKIHTENGRKYRAVFYDTYTENKVKKQGIFLVHDTGVDRFEYDKENNTFKNFSKNIDGFSHGVGAEMLEGLPLFPILRLNNLVFVGIGNQIVVWDGVIFQKKIKFSEITRIVGMTAYGDYVHIYATDGENSYKAIYDPVNDDEQPGSIRNFGKMEFLSVVSDGNVDIMVTDGDDIYQSSGLQIQPYIQYERNIYEAPRNYQSVIGSQNGKIYIAGENAIFVLQQGEIGTPPKISKLKVDGKVGMIYGSKERIFVGYERDPSTSSGGHGGGSGGHGGGSGGHGGGSGGEKGIFAEISTIGGAEVCDEGVYETLWYRAKKYGKITNIEIEANLGGKSGGSVEIFARRSLTENWTKMAEYTQEKWIQEREKTVLVDTIGNWHEVQFKIILKKSDDEKTPLLYSVNITYDDTNTATI